MYYVFCVWVYFYSGFWCMYLLELCVLVYVFTSIMGFGVCFYFRNNGIGVLFLAWVWTRSYLYFVPCSNIRCYMLTRWTLNKYVVNGELKGLVQRLEGEWFKTDLKTRYLLTLDSTRLQCKKECGHTTRFWTDPKHLTPRPEWTPILRSL